MSIQFRHPTIRRFLAYKLCRQIVYSLRKIGWSISEIVDSGLMVVQDHYLDKKLNIMTDEIYPYEDKSSSYRDGTPYVPTPYRIIKRILDYLQPKPEDIFLDFGCGMGRAVFFASTRGMKKAVGIELNKDLSEIAQRNLVHFKLRQTPIKLVQGDAVDYRITDENLFFLFNPFGLDTFRAVIENIRTSLANNPRPIRIAYHGIVYGGFLDNQDWLVREKDMRDINTAIWKSK